MDERQTIYTKTNTNNKRFVIYINISSTPRGGKPIIMLGCTKHSCEDTSGKLTLRSVKNCWEVVITATDEQTKAKSE